MMLDPLGLKLQVNEMLPKDGACLLLGSQWFPEGPMVICGSRAVADAIAADPERWVNEHTGMTMKDVFEATIG